MNFPNDLFYQKTDEWVKVDGDIATIGISDFAQDSLSDIVYVEIIAEPGQNLTKGETIASIESVKAAADVNNPVNGEVITLNESLADAPETLNTDPYGKGWLIKVKLSKETGLESLMDAATYEKYCQER